MKKILLVTPIKELGGLVECPPLGLGYLATELRKDGHEVTILDCVRERYTFEQFKKYISESSFDIIGFNLFSASLKEVKMSSDLIKEIKPNTITVAGGPHPSAAPEHTLTYLNNVDYGFRGEAETSFPLFVKLLSENNKDELKNVPGLIWREDGKIISNPPIFQNNIDDFEVSWDMIKPDMYGSPGSLAPKGWTTIITSRGCPYHCTFCSTHVIAGRRIRYRSINRIIDEMKFLHSEYNIKGFVILDENFTMNRNRVEEFCNKVIETDLKFKFMLVNGVRLNTLTEELLKLMKKAGFIERMAVGIESGSDRIRKMIKKELTISEIKEKVELMNHVGFKPIGYFIIGFPTETREEMQQTIDFALSLKLYRAAIACLLPLPGTEAYETIVANDELPENFDLSKLTTDSVVYAPKGMTLKDLVQIRKKAILKFNLRPRIIFDYMCDYNSFRFALAKFINIFI